MAEVREQRRELHSFKEELRGDCLSVKADVKRLKKEQELKWRYEGNKIQHEFNASLLDNLKQALWALDNCKTDYVNEILKEACETLKKRNKHVRIADMSETGWETVRQYELNRVASDSEDESRINRAESQALKRKKSQKSKKSKPTATFPCDHRTFPSGASGQFQTQTVHQQPSFRPFPVSGGTKAMYGACFSCGETGHIWKNCPYARTFTQHEQSKV